MRYDFTYFDPACISTFKPKMVKLIHRPSIHHLQNSNLILFLPYSLRL
jgi:hypothetical protein